MNTLKNIFKAGVLVSASVILAGSLSSCANDTDGVVTPEPSVKSKMAVTLTVPSTTFGTRAQSSKPVDPDMREGEVQSLYLVVFKQNDTKDAFNATEVVDITSQINPGSQVTDQYPDSKCTIELYAGSYKLYVLANFLSYWNTGSSAAQETQFKDHIKNEQNILNLSLSFDGTLQPENLPMICLPNNIRKDDSSDAGLLENGILEITDEDISDGEGYTLYAPLSILAAKVRYTVLFDNTDGGFSQAFQVADVDFTGGVVNKADGVTVKNVYGETGLVAPAATVANPKFVSGTFKSYLNQTKYPSADGKGEYLDTNRDIVPNNLTVLEQPRSWDSTNQRAWQGIVYVPENTKFTSGTGDTANYTTLHFAATGTGVNDNGYDVPIENISRGNFYDVVARLKNSTIFSVDVFIQVNPWVYNPSDTPSTW